VDYRSRRLYTPADGNATARYHERMPDWTRFHAGTLAGTLQGEIPRACELAWSWLDLAVEERRRRVAEAVRSEVSARWMLQALPFVRRRLWRDHGIDPDDTPRLTAFFDGVAADRLTPADREFVRRYQAAMDIGQAVTTLFPAAATPAAAVDPRRETLLEAVNALGAAIHGKDVAAATPASLAELSKAIDAFAALGGDLPEALARDHAWWLGMAWWAAGHGALELGHHDEGREKLLRAATFYEQGGDPKAADECRQRIRDLDARLAADFDAAADSALRALLVQRDPLGRAKALTALAREVAAAGDKYEAARLAEQAAEVLRGARYPDPEHDFDAATEQWIATAAETRSGTGLFARLCEVAQCWAVILGARTSARLAADPAGSARAEAALRRLPAWSGALFEEAGRAEDDAARRFLAWCPPPGMPHAQRASIDAAMQRTHELTALDDDLHRLREACNAAPDATQVDEATRLLERAQALGSRVHAARAAVERAYVLLALERHDEVPPAADLAVRTLFGEHPPALSNLANAYERELYLTAVEYRARALVSRADFDAVLALCDPVIRDIEGERARVSSAYQQSAFLATRVELYEIVAGAAWRTGRLERVLEVSELLKARAALRSRIAPATDMPAADVEAGLREINAALANAAPDAQRELRERRRWLVSARAIARARAAGPLPEVSLAAVQGALAPDEAAVSWFWAAEGVLIVLALTRDQARSALVRLDPAQQAQLHDYTACVGALGGEDPAWDELAPRTEALIASLGPLLLPAEARELVAGKRRLVLSPHRTLHLFPFHAVAWDAGGYLGERFAVRYAPNLASLTVPWRGVSHGPVLAVGVSAFLDPALPALPNAEAEASAVAAAHGDRGEALLRATRAQFLAQPLAQYRCLHLATHGSSVLAGDAIDDPLESAIELHDGALTGFELMALPLRAELVVLAACHSGQRSIAGRGLERLPGDDLFGLSAVLFEAGAGAVLGALWPVDDAVSLDILTDFHRAYAGGAAPDAALQAAVRAQVAKGRPVFDWAPFFVSALGYNRN
jgi:hypothetical protein